eukprot:COSAG02_NODE_5578_length_4217_cov_1.646673_1_plen_159_part_10
MQTPVVCMGCGRRPSLSLGRHECVVVGAGPGSQPCPAGERACRLIRRAAAAPKPTMDSDDTDDDLPDLEVDGSSLPHLRGADAGQKVVAPCPEPEAPSSAPMAQRGVGIASVTAASAMSVEEAVPDVQQTKYNSGSIVSLPEQGSQVEGEEGERPPASS